MDAVVAKAKKAQDFPVSQIKKADGEATVGEGSKKWNVSRLQWRSRSWDATAGYWPRGYAGRLDGVLVWRLELEAAPTVGASREVAKGGPGGALQGLQVTAG
jgi:hypothetical protein